MTQETGPDPVHGLFGADREVALLLDIIAATSSGPGVESMAAAVATMRLDLFLQNLAPFAVLMAVAIAWCVGSVMWLAPRMLTDDWFEQAIVTYGTLTGVAAVGLMLLRIADPHQRTTAAQAFAARSMVLSPLLGGGFVTATMPLLIVQFGVLPMLAVTSAVVLAAWFWPALTRASRTAPA